MTTARDLRQKYLRFFETKGHTVFPSGSLVPYDVTGRLDESLLFNGAGMVQFKPYFRGVAEPPNRRLVTAQKCVRTGDIESVGNLSHLTFFEMLGNFSFGDYFKKEAIAYSWEFMTSSEWLGLDAERLSFTVFEEDDVAFSHWSDLLSAAGIDPTMRVFRLGEETNYWPAGAFSAGPPGPCGPNSEMFYWVPNDTRPPKTYSREEWLADDEAKNWLEIWNDVFIQFEWKGKLRNPERPNEGYEKEGMDNLPFQSIDTGMGLERTATVLNGYRSVFETDAFAPILEKIQQLGAGIPDCATAKTPEATAARIIADHIRTSVFCIADGVLPGNTGRGYVLRRLIRRAVLKGQRVLGFQKPFFHQVYEGVLEALGDHYSELTDRRDMIVETLRNEEAQFRRTVAAGTVMLQNEVELLNRAGDGASKTLGGESAFRLYDTYGFPLEVTREICAECGIEVDEAGYEAALARAQDLSRGAGGMENVYAERGEDLVVVASAHAVSETQFVGYDILETESEIVQISPRFDAQGLTTGAFQVSLSVSPFYAESGGQVGDTGTITSLGSVHFAFEVTDTWKEMGLFWCDARLLQARPVPGGAQNPDLSGLTAGEITDILQSGYFFQPVMASVDGERRRNIIRNHSATHLLHAALRKVLGTHVSQAGSLVAPEHLRFDFNHGKAMSEAEREEVERIVNEQVLAGVPVTIHSNIPIAEAKKKGAMALFGEKYGDHVRMVEMPGVSLELCGGCHVRQTSEIGLFVLSHEGSAAGGVRRIQALTGQAAYELMKEQRETLRAAAGVLKTTSDELLGAIQRQSDELREERKKRERAEKAMLSGGGVSGSAEGEESRGGFPITTIGAFEVWTPRFNDVDQKIVAESVDDVVSQRPSVVACAALVAEGKVTFICKVGPGALKAGAHAGNIVREVAKVAGGGGGGRPEFATAGGRDLSKVDEALGAVSGLLG